MGPRRWVNPPRMIPQTHIDLFGDKKAFASLATVMPDGSPQVTPVWFDYADGKLRVNTARGRIKDRNMSLNARVAIAIVDPENPYRYVQVRGKVAAISEEGADALVFGTDSLVVDAGPRVRRSAIERANAMSPALAGREHDRQPRLRVPHRRLIDRRPRARVPAAAAAHRQAQRADAAAAAVAPPQARGRHRRRLPGPRL